MFKTVYEIRNGLTGETYHGPEDIDYCSIHEEEIRIELRRKHSDIFEKNEHTFIHIYQTVNDMDNFEKGSES